MRRRPTRRSTPSRIRRRRPLKNTAEVKYATLTVQDLASLIHCSSSPNNYLYSEQLKITNLFGYITQGTARDTRIGGKLYMKFLTFHIWTRACPDDIDYMIDHYYLRCIVSNTGSGRVNQNNAIADYFGSSELRNINGLIDRSKVTVYHDKVYKVTAGGLGTTGTGETVNCGPSRRISFTVPIGHVVDYIADSDAVRNDRDYMCLSLLIGVPGMNTTLNGRQIACSDVTMRFYYTDT